MMESYRLYFLDNSVSRNAGVIRDKTKARRPLDLVPLEETGNSRGD